MQMYVYWHICMCVFLVTNLKSENNKYEKGHLKLIKE